MSLHPRATFGGETGETEMIFDVRNIGIPCVLDGYPSVSTRDEHGAIPFTYRHGGRYVTRHRPRAVVLPTGSAASFLLAKYRCDLGTERLSRTLGITLHGGQVTQRFRATANGTLRPVTFCTAHEGGPSFDGNIIYISPIEPSTSDMYPKK